MSIWARYRGIDVVHVRHASRVAAIPSAAGPERLLEAGLADALESRGVPVAVFEVEAPEEPAGGEVGASFATCDAVARRVRHAAGDDRLAFVLAGSCHVGLGGLAGTPGERRGVVWLDAHGDFNTPDTTRSGLVDGTVLASLTGRGWRSLCAGVEGFRPVADEDVLLVGARSLDDEEAALLEASGVRVLSTAAATDSAGGREGSRAERALPDPVRREIDALGERCDGVYVHVDVDVLDPSLGRANAFAVSGGLGRDGLADLLGAALDGCPVSAVTLASYDPAHDPGGGVAAAVVSVAGSL